MGIILILLLVIHITTQTIIGRPCGDIRVIEECDCGGTKIDVYKYLLGDLKCCGSSCTGSGVHHQGKSYDYGECPNATVIPWRTPCNGKCTAPFVDCRNNDKLEMQCYNNRTEKGDKEFQCLSRIDENVTVVKEQIIQQPQICNYTDFYRKYILWYGCVHICTLETNFICSS